MEVVVEQLPGQAGGQELLELGGGGGGAGVPTGFNYRNCQLPVTRYFAGGGGGANIGASFGAGPGIRWWWNMDMLNRTKCRMV